MGRILNFQQVLGISNFTCPWTFAKTTTPINFSQYCTNAPNNARRWRLVRCTTIPNGTEFSVSLPGHAMLLPCHPAVFCALQEVLQLKSSLFGVIYLASLILPYFFLFFFFYFFFPMYEGLLQLLLSFSAFYKIMRGSNNANGTCRNRRIQCFVGLVPPPLLGRAAPRSSALWWYYGDGSLCGIASDKRKRGKNGVSSFLKNVSSSFCTYILMARKY